MASARWVGAVAVGLVVGCGSDNDDSNPAANAAPVVTELSFEMYRPSLWWRVDDPELVRRRGEIGKALATSGADVVCLGEVWRKAAQDDIVAAASARYPHVAQFTMDINTNVDDPTDADGSTPPAPTAPPCGPDLSAKVDATYACLMANCSTKPGSMDGMLSDNACVQSKCLSEMLDIVTSAPACGSCGAAYLPDLTFAEAKKLCTENPRAGLQFRADGGVLLLSKYPIKAKENWVLPSTRFRRNVLRAEVDVGGGKTVDVYCATLQAPFDALPLPYVGAYGKGKVDVEGWANENRLQAEKLVAYVERKSPGRAVVLVDTQSSAEVKSGDAVVITGSPKNPGTIEFLLAKWSAATPAGYTPACVYCPDHPWHTSAPPYWSDYVFMKGFDRAAALSATITRREAVFKDGGGVMVPLSPMYGFQATLKL